MIKHAQKQKSSERVEAEEALSYITYKIIYGHPTRFIPVHITMDRHEAHVMTSKYRNETGYDYIVYEFRVQDIGDAMMTGDKAYRRFYQYEAKPLHVDTLSNSPYLAQLQSGQNSLCK